MDPGDRRTPNQLICNRPYGKQEAVAGWASRQGITRLTWYSLLVLTKDQNGISASKNIEICIGGRRTSASLAVPCRHYELLDPCHGKGAPTASPSLRSTSRRSMDPWMGCRPSADQLTGEIGFQDGRMLRFMRTCVSHRYSRDKVAMITGVCTRKFGLDKDPRQPWTRVGRQGALIRID